LNCDFLLTFHTEHCRGKLERLTSLVPIIVTEDDSKLSRNVWPIKYIHYYTSKEFYTSLSFFARTTAEALYGIVLFSLDLFLEPKQILHIIVKKL